MAQPSGTLVKKSIDFDLNILLENSKLKVYPTYYKLFTDVGRVAFQKLINCGDLESFKLGGDFQYSSDGDNSLDSWKYFRKELRSKVESLLSRMDSNLSQIGGAVAEYMADVYLEKYPKWENQSCKLAVALKSCVEVCGKTVFFYFHGDLEVKDLVGAAKKKKYCANVQFDGEIRILAVDQTGFNSYAKLIESNKDNYDKLREELIQKYGNLHLEL